LAHEVDGEWARVARGRRRARPGARCYTGRGRCAALSMPRRRPRRSGASGRTRSTRAAAARPRAV